MAVLDRWQAAWKARALENYLKFYDAKFTGDGLDLAGWRARKKRVFASAGDIQLVLKDVQVSGAGDRVEVRFTQDYRSARSSDLGVKTMVLVREGGAWKILREDWAAK